MAERDQAAPDRGGRLGYLPAVDGLRAVAVGAVFLFHAGVLGGGFLGVDVFFVISGFLITALAIGEIERTGSLALGAFWARRARRLLPALFVLVAAVVSWASIDGVRDGLGRDVLATLAYVANWSRLRDGYEYFAAYDRPSLLEHTWSLAVEEQFYVVWPLVVVAAAAVAGWRSWSPRLAIGVAAVAAAIGSTAWAWWLSDRATLNRMYFGSDTRAVGLAVGCVAGCVLARGAATGRRTIGPVATALGVIGAGALTVATFVVDGSERWMYGPGFAGVALASVALVNAAVGSGPIERLLGLEPLAAVGRVSYGIYLWHWPVIVVLDGDRTGLSGPALGALWVAATALPVWLSWTFVERRAPLPRRWVHAVGYVTAAVVLAAGAVVVAGSTSEAPLTSALGEVPVSTVAVASSGEPPVSSPRDGSSAPANPSVAPDPAPSTEPTGSTVPGATSRPPATTIDPSATSVTSPTPTLPDRPLRLLVLGDSIAESLRSPDEPIAFDGIDVEVVNRSVIACPVTWEGRWAFDDGRLIGDPAPCDGDERFAADVAEVRPDVIWFLFGWSGTIAGRELPDGTIVAPCEPGFDDRYGAAYQRLVDRFAPAAEVVVATVAPPTSYRDDDQSDRPECINRRIRSLDVDVFDFGGWLCPRADCREAEPLMRDTVHFADSADVRRIVWPALVERILRTAGY